MIEYATNVHSNNLVRWAVKHPEALVLSGDLTGSTEIVLFRDRFPDRFFSMGMAEQNMISFAGGLAREGYVPLVHTFAVFMYRRALDQIEMSVAYPNLRVRLFGFLPGITTPGGASHQAINDIGVLRAVSNMTILEMGDATDIESVLDICETVDGPVYVRMLRKNVPRLFPASEPTRIGEARPVSAESNWSESDTLDLVLLTSGICTAEAIAAVAALREKRLRIAHLHVTTLKPFLDEKIIDAAARSKYGVVTMENHTIRGGLGTAVAELLTTAGVPTRVHTMGIRDTYLHGASQDYLKREYGLDAFSLIRAVEQVTGESLGISPEALTTDRPEDDASAHDRENSRRLEAL